LKQVNQHVNSYDEVLRQPYTLWKHEEIAQQSSTKHEIILEDNQEEKNVANINEDSRTINEDKAQGYAYEGLSVVVEEQVVFMTENEFQECPEENVVCNMFMCAGVTKNKISMKMEANNLPQNNKKI
jgi:hypothetical protein